MKIPIHDGETENENRKEKSPPEKNAKSGKITDREKIKLQKKDLPRKKKTDVSELKDIIANLKEELIKREEELVTAEDNVMRAAAETENFKKRMARENAEAKRYAAVSIVEDFLPAIDNLDKAVSAVTDEQGAASQLREGVELVAKQINDVLSKHGLERLDVVGKPFDPETSEAIQVEKTGDHEDETVIEEYFPGYKFKDRVIRHAKVKVAKNR